MHKLQVVEDPCAFKWHLKMHHKAHLVGPTLSWALSPYNVLSLDLDARIIVKYTI